jgi:hypothetical protein
LIPLHNNEKCIQYYKLLFSEYLKWIIILMPIHKSSDYKLSAVKYYLSHSQNQVETCKIFSCSERTLMKRLKTLKYLSIKVCI